MNLINLLLAFKYPAVFISASFEGPVTMAAVGFLFKLGYFALWPAYIALLLGDLAGDIGWYLLGKHGAHRFVRRFGKYFDLTEEKIQNIAPLFRKHEGKILFLSKMTMGFGFAVAILFTAGMSRVPLKKFIFLNILGGLPWTALVLFLGYTFGNIYLRVSNGLHIATLAFSVAIFLLALRGFSQYMKKALLARKKNLL